ncbi:phosphatase PAP2 family protein [Streptomyces antibioticus]
MPPRSDQQSPEQQTSTHRSSVPLLLTLPIALLALITWQVVVDGPLLRLDERISRTLVHPDRASELMSDLGDVPVAVPVLLLVAVYVARRAWVAGRRDWWVPSFAAMILMALVPLIVVPLKAWTARYGTPVVPPGPGYFPSGHTATAAIAYGGAALLLLPWLPTPTQRRTAAATASLLVLTVSYGLTRRGYHWPLDVLASWCLCTTLLTILWLLLRRVPR